MPPELARPEPAASPVLLRTTDVRPLDAHRALLLTLFKWKRLILGLGVLLTASAALAVFLQPPVWTASAKILLKPDRVPLEVPGVGAASSANRTDLRATETELLESTSVLLPVARELRKATGKPDVPDSQLMGSVDSLRARLDVIPIPNTNVLQTVFTAEKEPEAEKTLRLIVQSYVEQNAAAYTGGKRLTSFYDDELKQIAGQLQQAEEQLRRWQDANNVVTLDGQLNNQLTAHSLLEGNLKRTDVELGGTRALMASLTAQMAGQPERLLSGRQHGASPVVTRLRNDLVSAEAALRERPETPLLSRLRGDLVTAQLALADVQQRYTDEDRRVVEKRDHIARVEQEIATAERAASAIAVEKVENLRTQLATAERAGDVVLNETTGPNPLREGLARQVADAQARINSLSSQADGQRAQLKESETVLASLRGKRGEYDRLSRQVEIAKTLYLANAKRLDDARIVAGLETKHLGNVAVIEAPRLTGGRSVKRQMTIVGLAGVVGLGLGVAIALGAELLTGTLRTPDEAEYYLGLPVVAAVPAIVGTHPARAFLADAADPSERRNASDGRR